MTNQYVQIIFALLEKEKYLDKSMVFDAISNRGYIKAIISSIKVRGHQFEFQNKRLIMLPFIREKRLHCLFRSDCSKQTL